MKLLNQLLLAILGMVFLTGCKESTSILSLAGEWEFAIDSMDIGISKHWYTQSFPSQSEGTDISRMYQAGPT